MASANTPQGRATPSTTAISYYGDYRDEVDAEIALNEAEWERGYAAWEAGKQALAS